MKALLPLILCAAPVAAAAQHAGHAGHAGHAAHGAHASPAPAAQTPAAQTMTPAEAGQGGFAAVAEVVRILSADPDTDWSAVRIDRLVAHLRDMEALVTVARVTAEDVPGGARFSIGRSDPGAEAAFRMVPAHAPMVAMDAGWTSTAETVGDALVWTVTGAAEGDATRIRALGFFGLMALGEHHAEHHLAIARGRDPHAH